MNSCDSISDDESVGSCDNNARDAPMDAAEDVHSDYTELELNSCPLRL